MLVSEHLRISRRASAARLALRASLQTPCGSPSTPGHGPLRTPPTARRRFDYFVTDAGPCLAHHVILQVSLDGFADRPLAVLGRWTSVILARVRLRRHPPPCRRQSAPAAGTCATAAAYPGRPWPLFLEREGPCPAVPLPSMRLYIFPQIRAHCDCAPGPRPARRRPGRPCLLPSGLCAPPAPTPSRHPQARRPDARAAPGTPRLSSEPDHVGRRIPLRPASRVHSAPAACAGARLTVAIGPPAGSPQRSPRSTRGIKQRGPVHNPADTMSESGPLVRASASAETLPGMRPAPHQVFGAPIITRDVPCWRQVAAASSGGRELGHARLLMARADRTRCRGQSVFSHGLSQSTRL